MQRVHDHLLLEEEYVENQERIRKAQAANTATPASAGADTDALAAALGLGFDFLEVGVPAAAGGVVRVGDVVTELRPLAAEFTFLCHFDVLRYLPDARLSAAHLPANCLRCSLEARGAPPSAPSRIAPGGRMVGTIGFEPTTSTVSR